MRRNESRALTYALLLAPGAIGACSIINAYDDLVPQKFMDASTMPEAAAESGADAPMDVAVVKPKPSDGVIVLGATASSDAGDQTVLTALDPRTGSEFPKARVPMNVAAVVYQPSRDYWYVFESGGAGFYPTPTDPFYLHVRDLDRVTGEWTELATVQVPPGVSFLTTAALGDAITYVAYGGGVPAGSDAGVGMITDDDGGGPVRGVDGGPDAGAMLLPNIPAPYGLVTIDTHDLTAITACVLPLASAPISVVGTPTTVSTRGGYASLGNYPNSSSLTPVNVPEGCDSVNKAPVLNPPITLSSGGHGFGLVSSATTGQVVVATKGFGPGATNLTIWDPQNTGSPVSVGAFSGFGDGNIKPPAYSECLNDVFVIGTNTGTSVQIIPFGPTTAAAADGGAAPLTATADPTGHSGQGVYFEPYTNTILLPFSQGINFQLTAFRYNGSKFVPVNGTPVWQPPPDLRPNFVATRVPVPFTCTMPDQ